MKVHIINITVYTLAQAEQAIEYTKELLKKIEDIMYP
jgi:hypothetical protein